MSACSVVPIRTDYTNSQPKELRDAGVVIMACNIGPTIECSREITQLVKLFKDSLEEYSIVSRRQFRESMS